MIDRLTPGSAEYKFAHWKSAVGLPPEFPQLRPLSDTDFDKGEFVHFALPHLEVAGNVLDSLSAPRQLVYFEPGHGCTTLAQWVMRNALRDALRRNFVPAFVSLNDLAFTTDPTQAFEETLRTQIAYDFINYNWDRAIGEQEYAGILNADIPPAIVIGSSFFGKEDRAARTARDAKRDDILRAHKMILRVALTGETGVPDWQKVSELSPALGTSLESQRDIFIRNYGLRLLILFDTSSQMAFSDTKAHEDLLAGLYSAINDTTRDNWANITYFGTHQSLDSLPTEVGEFRNTSVNCEFPTYTSGDVFSMLSRRYQPRDGSLATVVDPNLVQAVQNGITRPIHQILQDFNDRILKQLAQAEDIPYKVSAY